MDNKNMNIKNMDILEKKEHYSVLYDFYECLLTDKQKEYFEAYYFNDMTLQEIASDFNVSRNAIFDSLKKVFETLDNYEDKLKLVYKFNKRNELYDKLDCKDNKEIIEELRKID